ncbi:MAG: PIN domain-containing protein [Spirochaetaceae bacterium]|jgi:predicted nucleic acid-binding protein|nr:PIN domain-containing protein [Spirochaetaceae bacterium]
MSGFALDTNIISFYLKDNKTVKRNLERELDAKIDVLIPPFAYYEAMRGLAAINAARLLRLFDELLIRCPMGPINQAMFKAAVDIYAELKAKGWNIDEIDILIAAWCKTYGLTLVTNNTRHFANIPGLALADWSAA